MPRDDLTTDYAEGYRAGVRDMREAAAKKAAQAGGVWDRAAAMDHYKGSMMRFDQVAGNFYSLAHDIRTMTEPEPRRDERGG